MVGVVGLSVDEFYNLSLLEAFVIREGYYKRLELEHLAPARLILTMIHNANSPTQKTAQQLLPLSFDEDYKDINWQNIHDHADELKAWALQTKNRA